MGLAVLAVGGMAYAIVSSYFQATPSTDQVIEQKDISEDTESGLPSGDSDVSGGSGGLVVPSTPPVSEPTDQLPWETGPSDGAPSSPTGSGHDDGGSSSSSEPWYSGPST